MTDLLFALPSLGTALSLTGLPGGSNKALDRSPYGNVGTITGATWQRLPSGLWCLYFDGTDDKVNCGQESGLCITGDFTVMTWVNPLALGDYCMLHKDSGNTGDRGWYLTTLGAGGFRIFISEDGTKYAYINSTSSLAAGTWQHVAAVHAGTSIHQFLNGVDVTGTPTYGGGASAITFGMHNSDQDVELGEKGGTQGLYGYLALPRMFNGGLTQFDIQTYFNQEKHLFGVW